MNRKLKIAQVSTPFISVPPKDYGGTELIVSLLTEGLVKNGHDVTLFATGDSETSAKLVSVYKDALNKEQMEALFSPLAAKLFWMHSLPTFYHTVVAFEQAGNFDIIHNHMHYIGLFFENFVKTPVLHTYHGDFTGALQSPIERMILEKYPKARWIAISEAQKRNCTIPLNFVGVIPHGIPLENYPYNGKPDDSLLWLGRITPKKGIAEAIQAAKATKKKLVITGVVNPRDEEFFKQDIEKEIDNNSIAFHGAVSIETKAGYYQRAKALLYPILWEEPFGLVMIEAMSCGTPVIAFGQGSVPEIIKDGETGFIVNPQNKKTGDYIIKKSGIEGLCEAIERIYSMGENEYLNMRRSARRHVEQSFTVEVMVEKYEEVYSRMLEER